MQRKEKGSHILTAIQVIYSNPSHGTQMLVALGRVKKDLSSLPSILGKDTKKNLRSYLLQESLLKTRKERTERTLQERDGPGQGRKWPWRAWV